MITVYRLYSTHRKAREAFVEFVRNMKVSIKKSTISNLQVILINDIVVRFDCINSIHKFQGLHIDLIIADDLHDNPKEKDKLDFLNTRIRPK